ncbi:hypothetical protein Hanom_Chr12g01165291 [Helianthus anomalus]
MNHTGIKTTSIRSSNTSQELSIKTQTNENKYWPVWINNVHTGNITSIKSENGPFNGCVTIETKDRTVRVIIKNHITAFSELCRNNIVPKYLILDTISHVSIQSKRGPHNREAVAFSTGTFLYKS